MQQEARLDEIGTNRLLVQQIDQARVRRRRTDIQTKPDDPLTQRRKVTHHSQVDPGPAGHLGPIVDLGPAGTEVELGAPVGDGPATDDVVKNSNDHLSDESHVVAVVPVRRVPLEHGELLEVRGVHTLVAEVTADLKDAVEAADHDALEERLGGNPEIEVLTEGVVPGHERAGSGARRRLLQDRRLHLKEVVVFQETTNAPNDPDAGLEPLP